MTRSEIIKGLPSTWGQVSEAFDAFVRHMATRQYGEDALRNAWGWFEAGYMAALAEAPAPGTDGKEGTDADEA